MENFLGCDIVFPFSYGPMNSSAVEVQSINESEVIIKYDMGMEENNCPECAGVAFIFDELKHRNLKFSFENSSDADNLYLLLELKDTKKRVYKNFCISCLDVLELQDIRDDTSEICIVCFKDKNLGKRGEITIRV